MTSLTPQRFTVPPLENGDRLSRSEFERRYSAMPEVKKAELIEGVVYMASPLRHRPHGKPHFRLIAWLGTYEAMTPSEIDGGDNSTIRLDLDNEPQPDVLLRIENRAGGQSYISEDGYIEGARSQTFPGLWLDKEALILGNMPRVMSVLQEGLASAEHQSSILRLQSQQAR